MSIREQIENSERLVKGRIISFGESDDADTFYNVDVAGVDKGIRLVDVNAPETAKSVIGKILNIENSITTPLPFALGKSRTVGQLLGPQYGSTQSVDFVKGMLALHGNDIYVDLKGEDVRERDLAIVYLTDKNNNLINLNAELLKAGMAMPYTAYGDNGVLEDHFDSYVEFVHMAKSGNPVGMFSRNAKDPEAWNNGYEISALRDAEMREQIAKSPIKNKVIHAVFNERISNRGFTIPSRYGASYFYQKALFNASQEQIGGEKFDYKSEGIATKALILSRIASGKSPYLSPREYAITRAFDVSVQRPGLGAYLNETIFIPSGMGRVYKEELGFFGSAAGLIGRAIDNTAVFYTADMFATDQNYALLEPLDIQYISIKSNENPGFFEQTLPALTNGLLTTSASLLTYFGFGVPAGMIMANMLKVSLNNMLHAGMSNEGNRIGSFFGRFLTLGPEAAFSTPDNFRNKALANAFLEAANNQSLIKDFGTDPTEVITKEISLKYFDDRPWTIFSPFTGLPNHVSRKIGALTFETVANVVVKHVIPYERGSIKFTEVQRALDQLITTVGQDIEIKATVEFVLDETGQLAVRTREGNASIRNLQFNDLTVGLKRAQKLMESYRQIFALIPLNPQNWRIWGGEVQGDEVNFRTLGDVLDFDDIAKMFRPMFDLKNGPLASDYQQSLNKARGFTSRIEGLPLPGFFKAPLKWTHFATIGNPLAAYFAAGGRLVSRSVKEMKFRFNKPLINNYKQITRTEGRLREAILREENLNVRSLGRQTVEQMAEKTFEVSAETVDDIVDLMILARQQEELTVNRFNNLMDPNDFEAAKKASVNSVEDQHKRLSSFLYETHLGKKVQQNGGRLLFSALDGKTVRNLALGITSISSFLLNPIFNGAGGAPLIESFGVNAIAGKEDGRVLFGAGNTFWSSHPTYLFATTAATIGMSFVISASLLDPSNDFITVRLAPQVGLDEDKVTQAVKRIRTDLNADQIADESRKIMSAFIEVDSLNNKTLKSARIAATKYKSGLFIGAVMVGTTFNVGWGVFKGILATGGNLFNRMFRGRAVNKLTEDVTLMSELALMQTNIANRVSQSGTLTDLDIISSFGIEVMMNQLDMIDKPDNPRNARTFATQIPLFAIQFLLAAETSTYYDSVAREQKNKVGFKFGIQSHQAPGMNFLIEAPIVLYPNERDKGPLGWVRQFQWNTNSTNAMTALTNFTTVVGGGITGLLAISIMTNATIGTGEFISEQLTRKGHMRFANSVDFLTDNVRMIQNVNSALVQGLTVANDLYVGLFGLATHPSKVLTIDVLSEVMRSIYRAAVPNKPKTAGGARKYFKSLSHGQRFKFLGSAALATTIFYSASKMAIGHLAGITEEQDKKPLYNLALIGGSATLAGTFYTTYARAATGIGYRRMSNETSKIFIGLSRDSNRVASRLLTSQSPKLTKHFLGYSLVGSAFMLLVTNNNFGLTQDMDRNGLEQMITVGTLGVGIGAIFGGISYVNDSPGALFSIYKSVLQFEKKGPKWITTPVKDITRYMKRRVIHRLSEYRSQYLQYQESIISKLVDGNELTLQGKEVFNGATETVLMKDGERVTVDIAEALNPLADEVFDDRYQAHKKYKGYDPIEARRLSFEKLYMSGDPIVIKGVETTGDAYMKSTVNQFNNKQFRAFSRNISNSRKLNTFVQGVIVTSSLAGIFTGVMKFTGKNYLPQLTNKGDLDNFYINMGNQGTARIDSARAFNNALKLITGTDREVQGRVIENNEGQIIIQQGENLRNITGAEFNRITRSLEAIRAMGLLNASNVFISVSPLAVGFSLRNAEEGIRATSYAQLQIPGFDISTAVYNMSRKYDFKSGYVNNKNRMLLEREVKRYNDMALSPDISEADLKYQQVVVQRAYASLESNSHVSKRSLTPIYDYSQSAQIGSSKILSILVKERMRTAKSFRYMSLSDLYNSSYDFSYVSTNSLLTEQLVANMMVNNPLASKDLEDRRVSIRLSYHLKNSFYRDMIGTNFSIQQALLKGSMSQGDSEYGPDIRPQEVPNAAMELLKSTIGNANTLLRSMAGNQPIIFAAFQGLGLTAVVSFGVSTLSMLSKAGAPDLSNTNNFLLSRMFGVNQDINQIPIFEEYLATVDRSGDLLVKNRAPVFDRHPGELVFRFSIKGTSDANSSIFPLNAALKQRVVSFLNYTTYATHKNNVQLLVNLYNLTDLAGVEGQDPIFRLENYEPGREELRRRIKVTVDADAFKEGVTRNYLDYLGLEVDPSDGTYKGKVVPRGSRSVHKGLYNHIDDGLSILIRNIPEKEYKALAKHLGLENATPPQLRAKLIQNLNIVERLQENYLSLVSKVDDFLGQVTTDGPTKALRIVNNGLVAKNASEARDVAVQLVNDMITNHINKELMAVQRALIFLNDTDPNDIYKSRGLLNIFAKMAGGVINLNKNPFKRHVPINPKIANLGSDTVTQAHEKFLATGYKGPRARRTIGKTLGQLGNRFTFAFTAITSLTDFVDSYGYTTQLGIAMQEGSYSEAELNYMAYESGYVYGRNLYNSILIGSGLALAQAGVSSIGPTHAYLAAKIGGFKAGGLIGLALVGSIAIGYGATKWATAQDNTGSSVTYEASKAINQLSGQIGLVKKRVIEATGEGNQEAAASVIGSLEALSFITAMSPVFTTKAVITFGSLMTQTAVITSTTTAAGSVKALGALGLIASNPASFAIGLVVLLAATVFISAIVGYSEVDKFISNRLMAANRSLANNFGMLGSWFSTPEGSAMQILDDTSSGPISFATPRQALNDSAKAFYSLSDDLDNTRTQYYLFGQIGSSRSSTTGLIEGENKIPFNSRILSSILTSRAQYFRRMIVGASVWRSQIEESSNVVQLKKELENEILYKERVTQNNRDVVAAVEKDLDEIQSEVSRARITNDETTQAMAVMLLANNQRDKVIPTTVDVTKQKKEQLIFQPSETDNRYLAFAKETINSLANNIQTVFVEEVQVAYLDNNEYKVERKISNRNDTVASITNNTLYVNSYV